MGFLANIPVWAAAPLAGGVAVVAVAGGIAWKAATSAPASAPPAGIASRAAPPSPQNSAPLPSLASPPEPVLANPGAPVALPPPAPQEIARVEPPSPPLAARAMPDPPAVIAPSFDIVRAEPTGDVLVAGRGTPGARIAVVEEGRVLASGTIDPGGQFVLLPPALKPGGHLLALEMTVAAGKPLTSAQSVAVSIAAKDAGGVLVALAEPGKPTAILSDPPPAIAKPAAAPPVPAAKVFVPVEAASVAPVPAPFAAIPAATPALPPPEPEIAIRAVEIEQGGGFFAAGIANAGANVRLYMNGTYVAALQANALGRWSLTITSGMQPGRYAVRADQVDPVSGAVTARAEVPFDYPATVAQIDPPLPVPRPALPLDAKPALPGKPPALALPPPPENAAAPAPPARTADEPIAPEIAPQPPAAPTKTPVATSADAAPSASAPVTTVPAAPDSPTKPALAPSVPQVTSSDIVLKEIQTATVVRGDSLWRISRQSLGQGVRYTQIYEANAGQIRNPSLIYIGQVLVLPAKP